MFISMLQDALLESGLHHLGRLFTTSMISSKSEAQDIDGLFVGSSTIASLVLSTLATTTCSTILQCCGTGTFPKHDTLWNVKVHDLFTLFVTRFAQGDNLG